MGMITTTLNARTNVLPDASETDLLRDTVAQVQHDRGSELWGLARHLGLSPEEADDAVQETLLRLWSALRDGAAIERPDAWAFRSLYRLAMDRHRWHRRVRLLAERLGAQPRRSSGVDHADRMAIWEAVEGLPERQRLAIYLRYRADLPYEEIGTILGIAAPSARSHVSHALDALRVELGEGASR
jgi:RNA polymerase sigma factor (sigma-70 family)